MPQGFSTGIMRKIQPVLTHNPEGMPQGLKPERFSGAFVARLKSCPVTKHLEAGDWLADGGTTADISTPLRFAHIGDRAYFTSVAVG